VDRGITPVPLTAKNSLNASMSLVLVSATVLPAKERKKVVGENDDCVRPTQLCDAQNLSCKNSKFFRCSVDADSMETGKCERFQCKNKRKVLGVDGTCAKPRCDAEGESCRNKRFFTCNTETGKCDRTRCKRKNKCLGTDLKCHWKPDSSCVA
jgi:hypothetical protein